ncbi:hypothetical protein [Roseinatronobacter bogoriensis]|uniref:hypothetical protein n=1 Tax=Roseinatronobacter bogoriensis TaxID=119542 RepID=UPI0010F1284E|nr:MULTISPECIES: hypothetical protein [Rhodobaca]MBB4206630.1 hypothetical protein [Rhodobaca bogoriensis DSM 18756]TDW41374.1 hypothetical protein LY39_00477 [Rhodobaca barguzinensis]TDY74448.1 hypothetical protein EV660_101488 [Rhodobaca bogoriensis DSM 18756]
MSDPNSQDQKKNDTDDAALDRELRALFERVAEEPVSDELKRLARTLEERLKKRAQD